MNIFKIITEIEKVDTAIVDRLSRRDMFKQATSYGTKLAAAAVPAVLAGMFTKAYGRTNASVTDVLNYALTLEYLESEFYASGLNASNLIPDNRKVIFQQISKHEASHVTFLKGVITSMSATPVTKPKFDFTANGTYGDVFSSYQTFLTLAQAFEDTGVRAYKGRAGELIDNDTVLTAALQIHSVEARHASMIRRLRGEKGWINNNDGAPAAVYAGEDNVTQGGVDITSLGYSKETATQAFDEPLTADQVLAIAGAFIKS